MNANNSLEHMEEKWWHSLLENDSLKADWIGSIAMTIMKCADRPIKWPVVFDGFISEMVSGDRWSGYEIRGICYIGFEGKTSGFIANISNTGGNIQYKIRFDNIEGNTVLINNDGNQIELSGI